ncbi:MAG: response regulator [Kiritimatiellae bacterium]|nr:response regulator [Kiritimatiellia bacterium]
MSRPSTAQPGEPVPPESSEVRMTNGDRPEDPRYRPYPFSPVNDLTLQTNAQDLQTLTEMAGEVMNVAGREALLRRAVEIPKEKLGLRRCSIFLRETHQLRGTFGTDLDGKPTEESDFLLPIRGKWKAQLDQWDANLENWMIEESVPLWGPGAGNRQGEIPWAVVTPIKGADKQTIAVFCNDPGFSGEQIDPHQQHLLAIYCSMLGSILERQFSLEAMQERDRILLSLTEASQHLLTMNNGRDAIEQTLRIMGEMTQSNRVLLIKQKVSALEDTAELTIPYEWNRGRLPAMKEQDRFMDLFRDGDELLLPPDWAKEELTLLSQEGGDGPVSGILQGIQASSILIAPIRTHIQRWGFLVLCRAESEDPEWPEPLLRATQTFSSSLAGAIGRFEAEETLKVRDQTLRGVASATNTLLTSAAFEQGVLNALEIIAEAVNVERVYIVENIRDALNVTPQARLSYYWSRQQVAYAANGDQAQWSYDSAFPGWYHIMKNGQTIPGHVLDVLHGTTFSQSAEVRAILFCPIMVEGDFWGFIGLDDHDAARVWSSNDRSVLTTIAGSLGGAIARKRAEDTLRESEGQFRSLIENASDMILEISPDGIIYYASPSVERDLKCPNGGLLGKSFFQWIKPEDQIAVVSACGRAMNQLREQPFVEFRLQQDDQTIRWIEAAIKPSRMVDRAHLLILNARDITERKHSEEALQQSEALLRHSQKMEAMGRLAGGVAHDFNNLLTVILGYSEMLGKRLPDDAVMREELQEMSRAAERAHGLTRQLLAFSRKQTVEPGKLHLNKIVQEMKTLLKRSLTEQVEITTQLAQDLWTIQADPGQIEQIIINLAVNARDAMPSGGRLLIETLNETIRTPVMVGQFTINPGEYVALRMQDNGTGMTSEVMSHLFEPFFTTKEVGKGTGLGLSMVYGIINQYEGQILVESQLGKGTTFTIFFPRVRGDLPLETPAAETSDHPGTETILIVEDEDTVRKLAEKMLLLKGYRILTAANGHEALVLYRQHAGEIDLILSDVVMPGMSGRALTEAIREISPDVPIVYMSGYARNSIEDSDVSINEETFVQKPFTPAVLYRKIRSALDKAQAT